MRVVSRHRLAQSVVPTTESQRDCLVPYRTAALYTGAAVRPKVAVDPRGGLRVVVFSLHGLLAELDQATDLAVSHSEDGGRRFAPATASLRRGGGRIADYAVQYGVDGVVTAAVHDAAKGEIAVLRSADNGTTWSETGIVAGNPAPTPYLELVSIGDRLFLAWTESDSVLFLSGSEDRGRSWSAKRNIDECDAIDAATQRLVALRSPQDEVSGSGASLLLLELMHAREARVALPDDEDAEAAPSPTTAIRSDDGGLTWCASPDLGHLATRRVFTGGHALDSSGDVMGGIGAPIVATNGPFAVATHPTSGCLYVAWQSGELNARHVTQILASVSSDGGFTWSAARVVNRTPATAPNPQAFAPSIAVTTIGYVGVLYTDLRHHRHGPDDPALDATLADHWLAVYDERLRFVAEVRLTPASFVMEHGVRCGPDEAFVVGGAVAAAAHRTFVTACAEPHVPDGGSALRAPSLAAYDLATNAMLLRDDNERQSIYCTAVKVRR